MPLATTMVFDKLLGLKIESFKTNDTFILSKEFAPKDNTCSVRYYADSVVDKKSKKKIVLLDITLVTSTAAVKAVVKMKTKNAMDLSQVAIRYGVSGNTRSFYFTDYSRLNHKGRRINGTPMKWTEFLGSFRTLENGEVTVSVDFADVRKVVSQDVGTRTFMTPKSRQYCSSPTVTITGQFEQIEEHLRAIETFLPIVCRGRKGLNLSCSTSVKMRSVHMRGMGDEIIEEEPICTMSLISKTLPNNETNASSQVIDWNNITYKNRDKEGTKIDHVGLRMKFVDWIRPNYEQYATGLWHTDLGIIGDKSKVTTCLVQLSVTLRRGGQRPRGTVKTDYGKILESLKNKDDGVVEIEIAELPRYLVDRGKDEVLPLRIGDKEVDGHSISVDAVLFLVLFICTNRV
eukprot:GHVS01101321.1.p1 GENE.GHVS01101321.1~~GHVS01101321.1.p1  ORF type:complete len:470 (-),score=19.83 GHVS01101321.1:163-1368(-)